MLTHPECDMECHVDEICVMIFLCFDNRQISVVKDESILKNYTDVDLLYLRDFMVLQPNLSSANVV